MIVSKNEVFVENLLPISSDVNAAVVSNVRAKNKSLKFFIDSFLF
jgi:hypothetical protein